MQVKLSPIILNVDPLKDYFPVVVKITGKNLYDDLYCIINNQIYTMVINTDKQGTCAISEDLIGTYDVSIEDSQRIVISKKFSIEILDHLERLGYHPKLILGDEIRIFVNGEIHGDIYCSFNEITVNAEVVSEKEIMCSSSLLEDGEYEVYLVDSKLNFILKNSFVLFKITPITTVAFTVLGNGDVSVNMISNLNLGQDLYCK